MIRSSYIKSLFLFVALLLAQADIIAQTSHVDASHGENVHQYLQNLVTLLKYSGDTAIPLSFYTEEDKALQRSHNRQEDLILTSVNHSVREGSPRHYGIDTLEITPFTWKWIHLTMHSEDKGLIDIKLRRPNSWIASYKLESIGSKVELDLPELGVLGEATLKAIYPNTFDSRFQLHDKNSNQRYRPVVGYYKNQEAAVDRYEFSNGDVLEATSNHVIWSVKRDSWVTIGALEINESVLTSGNREARLLKKDKIAETATVYNIEVYRDHNYFVGEDGILVHNDCLGKVLRKMFRGTNYENALKQLKKDGVFKLFVNQSQKFTKLGKQFNLLNLKQQKQLVRDILNNPALAKSLSKDTKLLEAWKVMFREKDKAVDVLRRNPDNLKKLNKFIKGENISDLSNLKKSFGATAYPEKWLELKIPRKELEKLFKNSDLDPPPKLKAWTPEHKAQRWKNYKGDKDFKSWSNIYDGNIKKAAKGDAKVRSYAKSKGLNTATTKFERTWPDPITIKLRNKKVKGKRRHDIYDAAKKKATEIKDYTGQKVYKSLDIEKEALMDIRLLKKGWVNEVEWVFLGKGPSEPLRKLLEAGKIKVVVK
ncbi:MAG: hypothetical protein GY936_20035 [Ignavibacteriae bacterium]|nr:hypothetical protein [Ignavibacteriota bacterium]